MLNTLVRVPETSSVGEDEFRKALRLFASGVTVIGTTDNAGRAFGMTATAFSSLSLRPPLVLVAVSLGTRCHKLIEARREFGISVLDESQADLSRHFGSRHNSGIDPKFEYLDGVPVLPHAIVQLACSLEEQMEGGDHSIFVGRVTQTMVRKSEPLIHFDGRYRRLTK